MKARYNPGLYYLSLYVIFAINISTVFRSPFHKAGKLRVSPTKYNGSSAFHIKGQSYLGSIGVPFIDNFSHQIITGKRKPPLSLHLTINIYAGTRIENMSKYKN
jgi:hypothetical protein